MKPVIACMAFFLALSAASVSLAGKPEWAGNGNGNGHSKKNHEAQSAPAPQTQQQNVALGNYFQDSQRNAALQYYGKQSAAGRCPPGLAKKNNGCMPPGQAKQWSRGQALPPNVMQYPVPPEVLRRLGNPPPGYKFIRVANDILLIAVGTSMVMDAIEDLMR